MPSYSRPRQPPASRGSKLGYYRASIACVGCRKSKTRCLLTPKREQDSCLNCRRKNQPCAFLTVDKKPPDWLWSKRRRQATGSESESQSQSNSSQLSVSVSPTHSDMNQDCAWGDNTETPVLQSNQQPNSAWDVDVDFRSFSFETLLPANLEGHVDPDGCISGNAEWFVSPEPMGMLPGADLPCPQYSYSSPSLDPGLEWDVNTMPLGDPNWYNQYLLQNGQLHPPFDPAAVPLSTPYDHHGHHSQVTSEGT
ncbi:uncharacterized protein PV07_05107 [Cladophialophora immunda]|uniref:Zn(2)-C6 fungal-type domain-containing protein n=1 Tax=Cladophialophora immunda TaxID=569365 RepID=A0A0D2AVH9_9EURO|nr:uncharacterized protein PV07_05107 [Cladophialophora immunda]KIW29282.1 hypothetical protein PV07_05107 [Cladophialophora immunda]OQV07672.1 Fungal Zn2-Cys6 binuclear cluster domain-containing protein [Cladophialophora immunda]